MSARGAADCCLFAGWVSGVNRGGERVASCMVSLVSGAPMWISSDRVIGILPVSVGGGGG